MTTDRDNQREKEEYTADPRYPRIRWRKGGADARM